MPVSEHLRPIVDPKSASNVPLPMVNARPQVKEAPDLAWRFFVSTKGCCANIEDLTFARPSCFFLSHAWD